MESRKSTVKPAVDIKRMAKKKTVTGTKIEKLPIMELFQGYGHRQGISQVSMEDIVRKINELIEEVNVNG